MLGRSRIKERIRSGELVVASVLRFPDPALLEIMALSGVQMVTVDYEHYPFNEETLINLARTADAHNVALIVRVPNAEPERIARIMDSGVEGIHLPSVDSAEEARALVDAVKYAPVGKRGFCPITRAAQYGLSSMTWEEYAQFSNEHSIITAQIETVQGVEELDKILAIPEIDIITSGASDLAASMGLIGRNSDPRVQDAVNEVRRKALAAGKTFIRKAGNEEEMRRLREEGDTLVVICSDQQMLMSSYQQMVAAAREGRKNERP